MVLRHWRVLGSLGGYLGVLGRPLWRVLASLGALWPPWGPFLACIAASHGHVWVHRVVEGLFY